jgi:multimeric flavodoxin WrbA
VRERQEITNMILGISASGRKDGITAKTVKAVLAASNCEYEYISLYNCSSKRHWKIARVKSKKII